MALPPITSDGGRARVYPSKDAQVFASGPRWSAGVSVTVTVEVTDRNVEVDTPPMHAGRVVAVGSAHRPVPSELA